MTPSNIFVCFSLILVNTHFNIAIVADNSLYDSNNFDSYSTGDWQYDDDEYVYEIDAKDNLTFYRCPGSDLEVQIHGLCDGFLDCVDRSDENPKVCQRYKNETDASSEIAKFSGDVLSTNSSFNFDYLDMSCSTDEFECPSEPGLCVPADVICDGHGDCPDGNDELYCGKTEPSSSANSYTDSALGNSASTAGGRHHLDDDTNFRDTLGMMERLSEHRRRQRPRNKHRARPRYRHRENYSHSRQTFHYFRKETLDYQRTTRPTLSFRTSPPVIRKLDPHFADRRIGQYQRVLRHEASEIESGHAGNREQGEIGESASSYSTRLNQMTDMEAERFLESQSGRTEKRKRANKKTKLVRSNANKNAAPNAEATILSKSKVNHVRSHKKKFQGLIGKLMNQVGKALISNSKLNDQDININISIRNSDNSNRNSNQQPQQNSNETAPKVTLQLEMDL